MAEQLQGILPPQIPSWLGSIHTIPGIVSDNPPAATTWRVQVRIDSRLEYPTGKKNQDRVYKLWLQSPSHEQDWSFSPVSSQEEQSCGSSGFHRGGSSDKPLAQLECHCGHVPVPRGALSPCHSSCSNLQLPASLSSSALGAHLLPGLQHELENSRALHLGNLKG